MKAANIQHFESYTEPWITATVHFNPETKQMHTDGDHSIRQYIGPVTPLNELPTVLGRVATRGEPSQGYEYGPCIPVADLRDRCLVDDERYKQLETETSNLRAEFEDYQRRLGAEVKARQVVEKENAELRQQLAGKWELGEPLTNIPLGSQFLVYNGSEWRIGLRDMESMVGVEGHTYYRLPTLPEPSDGDQVVAEMMAEGERKWQPVEIVQGNVYYLAARRDRRDNDKKLYDIYCPRYEGEQNRKEWEYYAIGGGLPVPPPHPEPLPKVPKCIAPEGCLGVLKSDTTWFYVTRANDRVYGVFADGSAAMLESFRFFEIYRGPVELPDGTTTAIEPDPALVAALGGE